MAPLLLETSIMLATARVYDYLKLDRTVSSQLRVRGWEKPKTAAASGAAAHHAVELTLIESGTVRYNIGAREHVVSAGDVMVVPYEVEHRTTFLTEMRGIALWIGEDLISEVSDAMGPDVQRGVLTASVLSRSGDRSDGRRMRSLLRVLADEVTEAEAGHTRAAEALADSVVIEMLRRVPRAAKTLGGTRGARDPRVLRAIAQMNESFADSLSVDDLAKTANMSRFHFSRLFRDEVGQAPYQYLLKVRLARAAELLRGGHSSVTEAAVSSGFSDFSRFSRMFKKHTGKLPTEVLREARSA